MADYPRRYGSRLRTIAPGEQFSPARPGQTSSGAQILRIPPADLIRQSPSGATLKTLSGGVSSPAADVVEEALRDAQRGLIDYTVLADQIALRLERALLAAFDGMRYATFQSFPFAVGTANISILQRPVTTRVYLFLINTHPVNNLFVAFDRAATGADTPIAPTNGFFEWLFMVPQNIINLTASAAATTGSLIFAELDPRASAKAPQLSSPAPLIPRRK
ncbi:MAG: hypothetical protein ACREPG_00145 [Candidatus Binatia bacterium]